MITEAGYEDIESLVDILNETYRGGRGWTTEKGLVSGDRATRAVINTEMSAGYKYYLYTFQDNYVGCFSLFKHDNTTEIGGLAVKPEQQGAGLGKLLLRQAEAISFSTMNTKRIIVNVLETRRELIRFYERCAYRLTDKKTPFPVCRGVGEPLVDNLHLVVLEKNV
ncbi:Ribosomal protein S18 acetylase RimI [Alteromonadaceae bacterium Bs31]|nr:Ribosomal protein S18 acetylase RimI [Alteromonadaceae bacterium Bs31]